MKVRGLGKFQGKFQGKLCKCHPDAIKQQCPCEGPPRTLSKAGEGGKAPEHAASKGLPEPEFRLSQDSAQLGTLQLTQLAEEAETG